MLRAFLCLTILATALAMAHPSRAQGLQMPDTPPMEHPQGGDGSFLDEPQIDQLEKMPPEDRENFFQKRREGFRSMSPDQIDDYKKKRREWFQSLPPERQEALKERMKKMREERRGIMKERLDKMPPEDRDNQRKKWQNHRGGKHDGAPGNEDTPKAPPADASPEKNDLPQESL